MEIIFENSDFVIFNKPVALNFHSEDNEAGFVVLATKQLNLPQLYSVHRLDKMTSGLLILAKSSEIANELTQLFQNREIQKFYLALSLRKPKKKQGWVKADMASSRRGSYMLTKTNENPAITQFISASLRVGERFFLVKPHTGKTHQIRVALKSIGSPIAGDVRYANADEAKKEGRGYLHAYALRFMMKGEEFSFVCPPLNGERFLSQEAQLQLKNWAKPWELFR
ncbi:MAG: RNA pseudouridine synthase [Helicobacteraceae bacterium CG2_30_36_10]|nr:MAG: RNA pseudouridine synthase [Helicobacteraceae bacterium CG2_30_36_10]